MLLPVTSADRELFIGLCREFYHSDAVLHPAPTAYHEATFDEMMRPGSLLDARLLSDGERVVGYGLLSRSFSPEVGGPIVWVEEIYLRPEGRGHGLGTEFLHYAKSKGAARVRLEACPDNDRAMRLYLREGFTPLPYTQMICDRE